jgi:Abnormal spindle-like microcephaly-assoc'd, ASPM-SPD-2-Hydin
VHVFSPSLLQELPNSPLPASFPLTVEWTVDPTAPLIYADQVYQVDPQTGIPSPILATSPISPPAIFSRPPGSQPVVGPVALLSATSLSFGSLSVGQTSGAQTLTITSNGGQALSLNTLAIAGTNSGDFTETDTCHAPTALQPGKSCSVLISFAPSVVGNRSATVTITDNTSPSTESVPLSGIGLAPAPAVTIVPGTLDFGTMTQGTSTPSNIVVTNAGTATLHISGIALGGANANDFGFSAPSCSNAIPVNATCTVTVTFTPLAAGLRSATLTLTNDAPNSPQLIDVKGNANPAFSVTAAPGSSTTASVTAGQLAQYQMVLTPGPGYSGSVSFTCSGAPLGATCHVPSSVLVANGVPAPFTVSVSTSGGAFLPPSNPVRFKPVSGQRVLPLLALGLVLLMAVKNLRALESDAGGRRLTIYSALPAAVFCVLLGVAGCGGGSAAVLTSAAIITPTGTSTIAITPTAMSSSGQPLQLQPIQLTLTVK